ncbi:hypothetical protein MTO96_023001, partial [Rhipicephalus appendiculatus]
MWQHCVEARVNLDRAEDEDEDRSRLTCSTSGLFSKYRRDDVHMRDCVRGDHAGRLVHHETADYIVLVYAGASGAVAVMLLLGTMSGNKGLVDLFLCFAKIRLLLYCLLAGFLAYEIFTHKDSKGKGFVQAAMIIPYLLARLPATKGTAMELFGID